MSDRGALATILAVNVATMRRVDAWLGVPACAFLTVLRKLSAPWARTPSGPVERILFVKLAEQGSTVLAHPALQRAVDRVGRENVYFLVFEQNRAILDAMEVIPKANVLAIRAKSVFGALRSTLGAVARMRRLKFDAAVDLEFFARSTAILTWLSGARMRVGLHAFAGGGPWRGDLLTHRMIYSPHLHTSQLFRLEVDALEQPADRFPAFDAEVAALETLPRGRLRPTDEEQQTVRRIVREVTGREEPPRIVLLNANCSDLLPLRRWPDDRYVELSQRLLDSDPELIVGFTGAPDEASPIERLVARIGSRRCVSFAGRTTLRELLVLYGLAEVLVTNDSGPAHFASLTPIDVVTLFGPETPKLFGVTSPRSHVMWAATPCSPCVNAYNNRVSKCTDNVCMSRIDVDAVFATVQGVLRTREREAAALEKTVEIPGVAAGTTPGRVRDRETAPGGAGGKRED